MSLDITHDEWLEELRRLESRKPSKSGWFDTIDVQRQFQCGQERARTMIREGIERGVLETCRVVRERLGGGTTTVVAYRLKRKAVAK